MADSAGSTKKTIVLGDYIEDQWKYYTSTRTSCDTGEPIVAGFPEIEHSDGGAGNVLCKLVSLGVHAIKYFNMQPAPTKVRTVVNNKVVMRRDLHDWCAPADLSTFIWDNVQSVVVADYAKGAITENIRRWLWLHRDKYQYLFVDTKQNPALWTDLRDKAIFFPNMKEYKAHKSVYDCMRWVVVKAGGSGAYILRYGDHKYAVGADIVPTINTCGAGDAFMAAFVAGVNVGVQFDEAAQDACEYVRGRLLINTDTPRTI